MADNNAQGTNVVDKNQILQALMLNMARQRAGQNSMSGIPGAAPSPAMPQNAATQGPSQQGGMPGAAPSPQSQAQPGAPAKQLSPASPTPFNGTFGDRKGIISQLVNSAEKRTHDKKVNEAEMYYNQINSFLASGQPGDQQKAQQLLDDPKIRKILKTGLDYVPLEEDVPPEAIGIHQAQQKIDKKQSTLQQLKQMLSGGRQQGNAQPRPQGKAVIPGPSQEMQGKYAEQQAKIGSEDALARMRTQEGNRDDAQAKAELQKADAETVRAEAEKTHWTAEADKANQEIEVSKKKMKDLDDPKSQEYRKNEWEINVKKAQAFEANAHAKYYDKLGNKLPGSVLDKGIKSTRDDFMFQYKAAIKDNADLKKTNDKNSFGEWAHPALKTRLNDSAALAKKYADAFKWYDSQASDQIRSGKMTLTDAATKFAQMVGADVPVSGVGDSGQVTVDTPNGLMTFPDQASADAFKKEAGIP